MAWVKDKPSNDKKMPISRMMGRQVIDNGELAQKNCPALFKLYWVPRRFLFVSRHLWVKEP